jgi:hypothetical protein
MFFIKKRIGALKRVNPEKKFSWHVTEYIWKIIFILNMYPVTSITKVNEQKRMLMCTGTITFNELNF